MLGFLTGYVYSVFVYFSVLYDVDSCGAVFTLSSSSANKLNVIWKRCRKESTYYMKTWMCLRIFHFQLEISTSWEIESQQSYFLCLSWNTNTIVSVILFNFISNDRSNWSIPWKFLRLKESISIRFGLEKHHNRPPNQMFPINIFNNLSKQFIMIATLKLNFSVTFFINRWLNESLCYAKFIFEDFLLTITHGFECSCYSQNGVEICG